MQLIMETEMLWDNCSMNICGLLAGFFAPLAFVFVQKYSVVPTMRVLYGIAFVMFTEPSALYTGSE